MRLPTAEKDIAYTPVAKLLHWVMVALLIVQFTLAVTMPHIGRNTRPDTLINLHFSFGVVILVVAVIRLVWRVTHREPPPSRDLPDWQIKASRIVHYGLYVLLLVIPVLGWMHASFHGFDVTAFGLFKLPALMARRTPGFAWTGDVHSAISYFVLLPVIALHVAAGLHHAIVRKDGVLARMLPERWV